MASELYAVPVGDEGELVLPAGLDPIVPDAELLELEEIPVAIAYRLKDDDDQEEWEHRFDCPGVRMFGVSEDGQGVIVITGPFDVSTLVGFTDTCTEPEEEEK